MSDASTMDPVVQNVGDAICGHLEEIAKLFKPGTKITILIRNTNPAYKDADMVLTDDTFDNAITALQKRKEMGR